MLCILYKNGGEGEWHTGEPGPMYPEEVSLIQADCDELEYLKIHFTAIPMPVNHRVVVWQGEIARFIVANL